MQKAKEVGSKELLAAPLEQVVFFLEAGRDLRRDQAPSMALKKRIHAVLGNEVIPDAFYRAGAVANIFPDKKPADLSNLELLTMAGTLKALMAAYSGASESEIAAARLKIQEPGFAPLRAAGPAPSRSAESAPAANPETLKGRSFKAPENHIRFNMNMPNGLHEKLFRISKATGKTATRLVEEAIAAMPEDGEGPAQPRGPRPRF